MSRTAEALLIELEAEDVVISTDGTSLFLAGNASNRADIRARVAAVKSEILDILRSRATAILVARDPHVPHEAPPTKWRNGGAHSDEGSPKTTSATTTCATCGSGTHPAAAPLVIALYRPGKPSSTAGMAAAIAPDGFTSDWPYAAQIPDAVRAATQTAHPTIVYGEQPDGLVGPTEDVEKLAKLANLSSTPNGLADHFDAPRLAAEGSLRDARIAARTLAAIAHKSWNGGLAEMARIEPEVRAVDGTINARGFLFDTALAQAVVAVDHRLCHDAQVAAGGIVQSPEKLRVVLRRAGFDVADIRRDTITPLLESDLPDDVRRVIVSRLASSGIIGAKIRAALRHQDPDGRIRRSLSYCKAHTGRWAGQGFQPQNLPRGIDLDEAQMEDARSIVLARDLRVLAAHANAWKTSASSVLATLVRACILAPHGCDLGIVDYRSIEPRVLMWLAQDHDALAAYAGNRDVYTERAAALYQVRFESVTAEMRALGKATEIGCGYQMGATRFHLYAETFGVDWCKTPFTAEEAVTSWRLAHEKVAGRWGLVDWHMGWAGGYWRQIEDAAMRAADGERAEFGGVVWHREGKDLVCRLPSGRPIFYRDAKLELVPTKFAAEKLALTYDHGGQRRSTYGGKLTENIVQAICRDLLAAALVRLESAGIPVVLHVHDECVAEITSAGQLEEMKSIMCEVPAWAPGLPLAVHGFRSKRYRK